MREKKVDDGTDLGPTRFAGLKTQIGETTTVTETEFALVATVIVTAAIEVGIEVVIEIAVKNDEIVTIDTILRG